MIPEDYILKETEDFQLEIGPGQYDTAFKDIPVYRIRHKAWGVIEAEGPNYVIALATLDDLQSQLEQYMAAETVEVPE